MSLSSEYSILASTFFNNVNDGSWKIYAILAVTSSGTEVVITDRTGRQMILLITDRKSLGASQVLGADGSALAVVKSISALQTDAGLVVRPIGTTSSVSLLGALSSVTSITNPVAVKYSINPAAVQSNEVLVAAAVATLIVTPAGGDQIFVRNDDATNVCWLGPSSVITTGGFKLVAGVTTPLMIPANTESIYGIGDGVNAISVSYFIIR